MPRSLSRSTCPAVARVTSAGPVGITCPSPASSPYVNGWAGLQSGVERKAPLRRFYSERSIESVGAGARNFQRWGFEQGGAALVGAMRGPEPIANALAAAISGGGSAAEAAREAQAGVEEIEAQIE